MLAQELYLLPDDAEKLNTAYINDIKKTQNEIYIYSADLKDRALLKALKHLAKQNTAVYLISKEPLATDNEAAHLSLFENIHVYTLPQHDMIENSGSFICIDRQRYYLIPKSLDNKVLGRGYAVALADNGACIKPFEAFLKRSNPY